MRSLFKRFITTAFLFMLGFQLALNSPTCIAKEERDFTLISADGPVSLHKMRGKVVMLFFGFTACPDVCPISLLTIKQVLVQLNPDELKRAKAFFITLDPDRDTPELLKQYTGYFHPNISGLTEKPGEIARIAKSYGVRYQRNKLDGSALGYVIDHTSNIFLIDPSGRLKASYPHNEDPDTILAQIRSLL